MVGLELEEGAKPPTAPAGGCQRVALDFTDLVSNRTSLHQGHRSGGLHLPAGSVVLMTY